MTAKSIPLLAALLLCGYAYAEGGCPPGMIPYSGTDLSSCGPIPAGYGQRAQPAGPHWEARWGAMATDPDNAALGAVEGLPSKRKAKRSAMAACKGRGGKACRVNIVYHNQCAAMIVGARYINFHGGVTVEEAIATAMQTCQADDTSCSVYYSACSMAELVQ
jgi:hypothetical protein